MQNELMTLRDLLKRASSLVDQLMEDKKGKDKSKPNYRRYLNGPLNEAGEKEMERRFEAGQTDSQIALAMDVSLTGVSKRRTMWRRTKA